mgnify:CR=1 FL=1
MTSPQPLIIYIEDDSLLMNMYQHLFTVHGFAFAGAKDFENCALQS